MNEPDNVAEAEAGHGTVIDRPAGELNCTDIIVHNSLAIHALASGRQSGRDAAEVGGSGGPQYSTTAVDIHIGTISGTVVCRTLLNLLTIWG